MAKIRLRIRAVGAGGVVVLLALMIGIILGVVLAHAGESTRVNLFDGQGRRTGYAVVYRESGRVEPAEEDAVYYMSQVNWIVLRREAT